MAEDANYPFAYSKYLGQTVERKVRLMSPVITDIRTHVHMVQMFVN